MSERRERMRRPEVLPLARHGQLKRSSAWRTLARYLAGALAVVFVSGASIAAYAVLDVTSSAAPPVRLANETKGAVPPSIDAIEGGVNLLVVGSDSREGQDPVFGDAEVDSGNLNDVTMLLHIAEDHSSATVVSFPRDMFVPIPACPKEDGVGTYSAMAAQKINTTLSYGGLACTVLTVESLTGLSIPFAAEVQFGGVIELSNAIGGVNVCVAAPINDPYTDLHLTAGEHSLEGLEALQFLRTRHGVGDGSDLGRISNQQVFLSALVRTMQDGKTLSDPTKLFGIAKAAANNMRLSTSLSDVNTMVSIAMALKDIPRDKIAFVQYPNAIGESNGQSGVLPLTTAATTLFDAIKADKPLILTGDTGVGSVVEGQEPGDPASPGAGGQGTEQPADPAGPTDPATADPSAPAQPGAGGGGDTVELPSSIQGQTADDVTCSAGAG